MKKPVLFKLSLFCCFACAHSFGALDRLTDFALLDAKGEFHQLSRYLHRKALVMMTYDANCPAMEGQLAAFLDASMTFNEDDFEFVLLDAKDVGRDSLAALNLPLPVLADDGQLVSESFGVTQSGEVLILNPLRLSLYYRGSADSSMEQALSQVLSDSVSDTLSSPVSGCEVSFPVAESHKIEPPDYATEVAPIIADNCTECHRQGGVGPFAMDSYIMLLGWSPMIREVLLNKRMPPTQVDPLLGHSKNARYVDKEELQTLIHWIDAGGPRGDSESDPLEELVELESNWELGEPDFVVAAPEHEIPATGVLDYYYKTVALPFAEDRWIESVQIKAGDESVLHHLMVFVTAPGEDFWGAERDQVTSVRRFVEGYSPGKNNVSVFPEGTGVLVPAGHSLSMQFHYVTNGQATVDATQIALYFSDREDLVEKQTLALATRFEVPANTHDFPQEVSYEFEEPVVLFGVRARMNDRGKKMKFVYENEAGEWQDIFSIPAYNYGWQPHYLLDEPIYLKQGARVKVVGAFDNSASNPTNPDPSRSISFGLESWEEMFAGYFSFYPASP